MIGGSDLSVKTKIILHIIMIFCLLTMGFALGVVWERGIIFDGIPGKEWKKDDGSKDKKQENKVNSKSSDRGQEIKKAVKRNNSKGQRSKKTN